MRSSNPKEVNVVDAISIALDVESLQPENKKPQITNELAACSPGALRWHLMNGFDVESKPHKTIPLRLDPFISHFMAAPIIARPVVTFRMLDKKVGSLIALVLTPLFLLIMPLFVFGLSLYSYKKCPCSSWNSRGSDTIFVLSAKKDSVDMLKVLRKYKPNVEAKDNLGNTALLIATNKGYCNYLVALLDLYIPNLEALDSANKTALWIAAERSDSDCMMALLTKGANPAFVQDRPSKRIFLHLICEKETTPRFNEILNFCKTVINTQDSRGRTPLMIAFDSQEDAYMTFLKDIVSDILRNGRITKDLTKLLRLGSNLTNAKTLIDAGTDLNIANNSGKTAVMCAIEGNFISFVKMFINTNRVKWRLQDEDGLNAVDYLFRAQNFTISYIYHLLLMDNTLLDINKYRSYDVLQLVIKGPILFDEKLARAQILLDRGLPVNELHGKEGNIWVWLIEAFVEQYKVSTSGDKNDIVRFLKVNKADPKIIIEYVYDTGDNVLMWCGKRIAVLDICMRSLLIFLLENGSDLRTRDEHGLTLLSMEAATPEIGKFLRDAVDDYKLSLVDGVSKLDLKEQARVYKYRLFISYSWISNSADELNVLLSDIASVTDIPGTMIFTDRSKKLVNSRNFKDIIGKTNQLLLVWTKGSLFRPWILHEIYLFAEQKKDIRIVFRKDDTFDAEAELKELGTRDLLSEWRQNENDANTLEILKEEGIKIEHMISRAQKTLKTIIRDERNRDLYDVHELDYETRQNPIKFVFRIDDAAVVQIGT